MSDITPILCCPTCATRIDPSERCPAVSVHQCDQQAGHFGPHRTVVATGEVRRWGPGITATSCGNTLNERDWCVKKGGHGGSHNNGHGMSWGDDWDWMDERQADAAFAESSGSYVGDSDE